MPATPGLRQLLRALGRRHPRTRGTLRVAGPTADVVISRDRWGIPHVDAASDADAWFALGFCHGQDRGFQLELLARAGRGALAELVGPAALPLDRLSRTLGFRRLAAAQRPRLDGDILAALEAYVAGINAAAAVEPRPHELVLLRGRRSAWTVEDVLAFLGLQSLALSGNWDTELARLRILLTDGADALRAVEPTYGPWLPAVVPVGTAAGPALDRLAADVTALRDLVAGSGASNAWAVAGARTSSGAPILANDPHLAPGIPAPWYLAHLRTPEWSLAGASFVGGPAFPTGHNGTAAWGITAGCTDSADLFWEDLDPAALTARGPDGIEPVERHSEVIEVRGGASVVEEVFVTERGPIVTSLLDGLGVALSLRATWLEPLPVRGFLGIHRARDFATFRNAFRHWPGPALNVVYADAAGHIGWQLVGTLPRRRAGNGTLPAPAWSAGWAGEHVPFDEMPWCLDPEEGFVVSANNAPRAEGSEAAFLGVDWLDGYRAARLVEAVGDRLDWDVASTAALQTDVTSVPWLELREMVLAADADDEPIRTALGLLAAWDGRLSADSRAATVYELFVSDLAAALARQAAPRSWPWAIGAGFGDAMPRTSFGARTLSQLVATLGARPDRSSLVSASMRAAIATLREVRGDDPARWAWGEARPLRLRHPLGVRAPFDRLFNVGPVPLGGDANTVAQAGVRPMKPLANPAAIANHRSVIDLADVERSRFVLAGGQSGNPLSPHYADLFELWQRGDAVPIAWSEASVAAATVDRLVLRPATSRDDHEENAQ
ncbi:MAG TPA: penicillin acylase family protein [Candidatus Limnocylindria bacterium]|nr:penicillin acylase family protein [Candidatus Limnocylindria bacterium]